MRDTKIILLFLILPSITSAQEQSISLYNDIDYYEGHSSAIYTSSHTEEDISVESFPNLRGTSSFTLNGTWILYQESNFRHFGFYGTGNVRFSFGSPQFNVLRSARVVGKAEDAWGNTFNCFEGEYYEGSILTFDQDSSERIFPCASLILTGKSDITLYSGENYSGSSQCLKAPLIAPANAIKNSASLGISPEEGVGSFRFGCHSRHIVFEPPQTILNSLKY